MSNHEGFPIKGLTLFDRSIKEFRKFGGMNGVAQSLACQLTELIQKRLKALPQQEGHSPSGELRQDHFLDQRTNPIEVSALLGVKADFVTYQETQMTEIEEIAPLHFVGVAPIHNVLIQDIEFIEHHVDILIQNIVE